MTDPHGATSDLATQQYVVTGRDGGAFAGDDAADTTENAAVSIDVLANDVGNGLTLTAINGAPFAEVFPGFFAAELPSGATVILQGDGHLEYSPGPLATVIPETPFDFLGDGDTFVDSFTYAAESAEGDATTGQVTVTIQGENDAPQAIGNIISQPVFIEGTGLQSGQMTFEDYDDDIDDLTVTLLSAPLFYGDPVTVTLDGGLAFTVDTSEFAALDAGEEALFTFSYLLSDPGGAMSPEIEQSFVIQGADEMVFG